MSTPDPEEPETYHGHSVDDEDQPQPGGDSQAGEVDPEDTASDLDPEAPLDGQRTDDDTVVDPPEDWSAGQRYGNTPYEEEVGETLDQRVAQEEPEEPAESP